MLVLLLIGPIILTLDVREVLAQGPVPVISGPTPSNQVTINVTIDFGDSNRAIIASEIGNPAKVEVVGGTVSNKVPQNSPQDTVWLVTIDRAGGNSDVNVTVHSGWYQDEAENWNFGASKVFSSPIPGDINGDDVVDIFDAILLAGAFDSEPGDPDWNPDADINKDEIVDIFDAIILATHFGESQ